MNAVTDFKQTAVGAGIAHMSEEEQMQVLETSIYRGAKRASIKMVLSYCKAAGLDPLQKPVHIVPVNAKNPQTGQWEWVDTVWPGINLYRTQAARTGRHAGTSEPEFGPMVTQEFTIREDNKQDRKVSVTFPEWCRVVVRKVLDNGTVAEFVGMEYWVENYATKGKFGGDAPNDMWNRRPRGQLAKCSEAQALRKAFPEFASAPTAEEMEGKTINEDGSIARPTRQASTVPTGGNLPQLAMCEPEVLEGWLAKARDARTDAEAVKVYNEGLGAIGTHDTESCARFKRAVVDRRNQLRTGGVTDATVKPATAQAGDAAAQAAAGEQSQLQQVQGAAPDDGSPFQITTAKLFHMFESAVQKKDVDALDIAADWIPELPEGERAAATAKYDELRNQLKGQDQ